MTLYDVLGIGAPIIDQILQVSEEYLATLPEKKGGMQLTHSDNIRQIIKDSKSKETAFPGGSCSNVIRGLANFGHKCALMGKIGNDELGGNFIKGLKELGIIPLYSKDLEPTAQALCLVTPDGQRTFYTYMGAGEKMNEEDLNPSFFQNISLVHIEGYALNNGDLAKRSMEYAKAAGAKISFDLANFNIAESFRESLADLLSCYVDIVFANEQEVSILTGATPKQGCSILQNLCSTAVVTLGKEGCWVGSHGKLLKYPAYPENPLDTTGAGDLFTSGFLHGYLSGFPVETCAHYGALASAAVVQILGAELPPEAWAKLKRQIALNDTLSNGKISAHAHSLKPDSPNL